MAQAVSRAPAGDVGADGNLMMAPRAPTSSEPRLRDFGDWRALWAELCAPKIYMLNLKPPVPQNVAMFGDRTFKAVIKFDEPLGWALISSDWAFL